MNLASKIVLLLLAIALTGLTSCIKEEQYPIEPVIRFERFATLQNIYNHDSLGLLTISYTDGDGDIGLYDTDTAEPYRYNYFLKFKYMKNGELLELTPADTALGFNARIPILTPAGKNKNIKGEISMELELYYAWPALESDTISFEVYIRDRALHSSNIVQTPLFIISKP
jgi:hypothetical protein